MIIASDNHAYRRLTPFAPVIRGHKCLFWRIVPPPPRPWAQSVAPAGWQGRVPRQSRPPCHAAGAAARTHTRAPSPQGAGSRLTPFAPVIRGHKCLFWRIVPPPPRPWAQSVAPAVLGGRRIAANPPRPTGAAACTHTRAPSPQGAGSQQIGAIKYFNFSCREPWACSPRTPAFKIERRHLDYCRGLNGDMKIKRKNYFS